MKILHKYVLKEHLGPLVFSLTALTSLMLLQYIAKKFGELVGKGLPTGAIVEFLALSIPLTVALTLPMAVLVSTLYAFSRLASENEVTALKASGIGLPSILKPVLLAAAGVTVLMVLFNDQVLSYANHRLRVLQTDIAQKKPTFGLREQIINEVSPGKLYLRAGRLDQKNSNRMRDVTIYDMSDPSRRRTIFADSGNMSMSKDQRDLELTLYNGSMQDVPVAAPTQLQRLYFDVDHVRVRGVGNEFRKSTGDAYKSDREMSICEMRTAAAKAREQYTAARVEYEKAVALAKKRGEKLSAEALSAKVRNPSDGALVRAYCAFLGSIGPKVAHAQGGVRTARPDQQVAGQAPSLGGGATLSPAESAAVARASAARLGSSADMPAGSPSQPLVDAARARMLDTSNLIDAYYVEIHKKFALAVACFVFVLLGAPIALRFPRGGVGLTIGVSLIVFAVYYVFLIGGEALAKRGYVPPFISMWLANILFGIAGVWLLGRMGTESGSSRGGGDAREMMDAIRRRIPGLRDRVRAEPA